jgi:copper transport protein
MLLNYRVHVWAGRVAAASAAIIVLLAVAAPALAHAVLLRSNPAANAALDQPPVQVELWFSEPVEPAFTEIRVFNSNGVRVDDGATRLDPADATHARVGLRVLGDGIYTVSWKALSTVDGHVTLGSFPFAVGQFDEAALAAAGAAGAGAGQAPAGEVVPRWLGLLGIALFAGSHLFTLVVWRPAWREAVGRAANPVYRRAGAAFRALRRAGVAVFLAAGIGGLLWQAESAGGLTTPQALTDPALGTLLFGTRYGLLWLIRVALALFLLVWEERWENVLRYAQPAAAAVLVLSLSLNSHAAAAPNPILPVLSDWVHIMAACAWVGGLAHLALGLFAARQLEPAARTRLAASLIPRFSNLGLAAVATLLLTGLYNSWITVGTLQGLFYTDYGQGLLVKLWLLVPLISLAGINLLVLRPALQSSVAGPQSSVGGQPSPTTDPQSPVTTPHSGLSRHFLLSVGGEVALAAAVLFAAASFATIPPARTLINSLAVEAQAEDVQVNLTITPARVGVNEFDVRLTDAAGQPLADAAEVALRFTLQSQDVAAVGTEAILVNRGDGHYGIQGSYFSLPGEWQTLVVIRRAAKFDAFATFRMDIQPPGAAPGASGSAQIAFARASAVALYVLAVLFVLVMRGLVRSPRQQAIGGIVPALALALAGIVLFTGARSQAVVDVANPIPPSAASLATGKSLYEQNCLACHGPAGLGDGPAGLLMNPRPADLQQHMIPGVHTDGQIFDWITNGYPGSAMPAFRDTLTEEERWHVQNYIRTLVPPQ